MMKRLLTVILASALSVSSGYAQTPSPQNTPINALPPAASVSGTDLIPIFQNGVTKSAQIGQINSGVLSPGGSNGQLQYNASGIFGGFILGGDCTFSVPNITCTKTGGVAFATSATTDTTNASNISSGTLPAGRMPLGLTGTPSSGQIPVGNAGGTAYANQTVGGDGTLSSAASLIVTKTNGVSFAPSATTDTTNAANISSGTLPNARMPNPGASALGGVDSKDCTSGGQFIQVITTAGAVTCGTPAGGGNVSAGGTLTSGEIVIGQGTQAIAVDANAALSAGALSLGASGTAGSVVLGNATSGTVTIQTVAGALGSVTASLPANTGTISELNLAETWTALQTFTNSDIALLGSSTGKTTFTSANSGASNFTITVPATTDTLAVLGTFASPPVIGNTTPAAGSFTVLTAYGNTVIANGSLTLGAANTTLGTVTLEGSISGAALIEPQTAAGTPTLTLPNASGTLADGASSPLALDVNSGNLTCATCVTSASSLTSTDIMTGAGLQASQVDANASLSAGALSLGASGTVGTVALGNATSGTVTLGTVAGALGSVTASLPANTGTIAELNAIQSWTAAQRGTPSTITISTATFTPSFDAANNFSITLVHAACPCTLANPSTTPVAGQSGTFVIAQSATGSDTIGTWGSQYEYAGGTAAITLSTGASVVDIIPYFVLDSTHIILGGIVKGAAH